MATTRRYRLTDKGEILGRIREVFSRIPQEDLEELLDLWFSSQAGLLAGVGNGAPETGLYVGRMEAAMALLSWTKNMREEVRKPASAAGEDVPPPVGTDI